MLRKCYAENVLAPLFSTDVQETITALPHSEAYGLLLRALNVASGTLCEMFGVLSCYQLELPSAGIRLAVTFYQEEKDFTIDTVDITESPNNGIDRIDRTKMLRER